jgi:hypothetical protein
MRVTDGNKVGVLLRPLAARDAVICLDKLLRERRVFEGPETQVARLELVVLSYADIVLTVACCDQVGVFAVDIDAGDLPVGRDVALEGEQRLQSHLTVLELLLDLLILFLFGLLLALPRESECLLSILFVIIVLDVVLLRLRVVFVLHMLVVELGLRVQTLDDTDCSHH